MGLRGHQIPLASVLRVVDPLMSIWLTQEKLEPGPTSAGTANSDAPLLCSGNGHLIKCFELSMVVVVT